MSLNFHKKDKLESAHIKQCQARSAHINKHKPRKTKKTQDKLRSTKIQHDQTRNIQGFKINHAQPRQIKMNQNNQDSTKTVYCCGMDRSKMYPYWDETRDIQSNITLCLKEFPRAKPEGTLEGKGLYLTVYPESSPNTDIISF